MGSLWEWLSDVFWTDSFWLVPGYTWADVTNGPDKEVLYPETKDFLYQIPLTLMFLVLRYTLEKYCFQALGRALGIKNKKQRVVEAIPLLESAYRKSRKEKDVIALAKQLDMTEREVERWWRLRRNVDKPSKMTKFCEHAWRATYFGCNSLAGLYILWDKDYFWDINKCFIGYPHQGLTNDIWWYYTLYSSHTWSTVITVYFDVRRKDFLQSVMHHVIAVLLLTFTWITNFYRIGVVAIPSQDGSGAIIELTKAFKTAKYDFISFYLFFVFIIVWFYTRMYILPFQIMHGTMFTTHRLFDGFPMGYILNVILLALVALQVYWSILIVRALRNWLRFGIERDVRSSSSEASDDDQPNISNHCVPRDMVMEAKLLL
ncbi:ceramide synthase 2-like [Anticarsia gemmatalis]|uniref:ceramide synthase 2-like n=1 Tax=Anticarsia gemmatalis TaxID=129554 RepID=UPI003F769667